MSTKTALGWISLGLILIGFLALGHTIAGVAFLTGMVTAIVSIVMPENNTGSTNKKGSNAPAAIALSLIILSVLLVAISVSGWH